MDFCKTRPEPFLICQAHPRFAHLSLPYLPIAPIWKCIHWGDSRKKCCKCAVAALSFGPRENNDQRGSSDSGPTTSTLFHHNFSFQPCFSRLHAFVDYVFPGTCDHDYLSLVFQHQFRALPASVATFFQTMKTVLPKHARSIPTHCFVPEWRL